MTLDLKLDDKNGILINCYYSAGMYLLGGEKEHWEKEFNYWANETGKFAYNMQVDLVKRFYEIKELIDKNDKRT